MSNTATTETKTTAAIYSAKTGDTITDGLQSGTQCDEAIIAARRIAREQNETVILDDPQDGGEFLVGPRGGVRKLTDHLKRKMGFSVTRDRDEESI